jgi:hypothetical protein
MPLPKEADKLRKRAQNGYKRGDRKSLFLEKYPDWESKKSLLDPREVIIVEEFYLNGRTDQAIADILDGTTRQNISKQRLAAVDILKTAARPRRGRPKNQPSQTAEETEII